MFCKKPKLQNIRIKEFLSFAKNLQMSREFSEQELVREESLQKLIDLGINPYLQNCLMSHLVNTS